MFKQLLAVFVVLCCFSSVLFAANDNPFAKNEVISIGKDVAWKIDNKSGSASKTVSDDNGIYYHLIFDNKQIRLSITDDEAGTKAKSFTQLEIKDVQIAGRQLPLFRWCLKNQDRHDRFLQQGLTVKKNICSINGRTGTFIMRLNKDALTSLQKESSLTILLKPFRKPLQLDYDISDFTTMQSSLSGGKAVAAAAVSAGGAAVSASATPKVVVKPKKKCQAKPPAQYKKIKSIEYVCDDSVAKKSANSTIAKQVDQEKARQKKQAAEKEKQRKLAEEKKQQELAVKLKQEELLAAEAAALAASEAKQSMINDDITQKMVKMCEKYWDKGEHRCYCQKYIEHAPSSIQASSTCN